MSMIYEIKHRHSGAVLFALECDSVKVCLETANLRSADLAGADLRGAYLRAADLRGANLGDADLRGANLRAADLRGANLGSADLRGANLGSADLRDAYLRSADLAGAELRGAYLRSAELRDAYLEGADLAGADLAGANLAGVHQACQLGQPNGWHAWTYLDKTGLQRIRVGCREFTIAEGREYWAGKPDRREILAALDYAEAIGRLREWDKPGEA